MGTCSSSSSPDLTAKKIETNIAFTNLRSFPSQKTVARAKSGNLNHAKASPKEYQFVSEIVADSRHQSQKTKDALTQNIEKNSKFF